MKAVKYIVLAALSSITQNCKNFNKLDKNSNREYYITKKDSANVEQKLLDTKNVIFIELYEISKKDSYKRKNIRICDTIKDVSYSHYGSVDMHTTLDRNKHKLFDKWLDMDYLIHNPSPPDYPDGSMDLARALDFYNSRDLELYIDSLRGQYYKDVVHIDYKNNIPDNATVPYISKKNNK